MTIFATFYCGKKGYILINVAFCLESLRLLVIKTLNANQQLAIAKLVYSVIFVVWKKTQREFCLQVVSLGQIVINLSRKI